MSQEPSDARALERLLQWVRHHPVPTVLSVVVVAGLVVGARSCAEHNQNQLALPESMTSTTVVHPGEPGVLPAAEPGGQEPAEGSPHEPIEITETGGTWNSTVTATDSDEPKDCDDVFEPIDLPWADIVGVEATGGSDMPLAFGIDFGALPEDMWRLDLHLCELPPGDMCLDAFMAVEDGDWTGGSEPDFGFEYEPPLPRDDRAARSYVTWYQNPFASEGFEGLLQTRAAFGERWGCDSIAVRLARRHE